MFINMGKKLIIKGANFSANAVDTRPIQHLVNFEFGGITIGSMNTYGGPINAGDDLNYWPTMENNPNKVRIRTPNNDKLPVSEGINTFEVSSGQGLTFTAYLYNNDTYVNYEGITINDGILSITCDGTFNYIRLSGKNSSDDTVEITQVQLSETYVLY